MSTTPFEDSRGAFATTRWSAVVRSRGNSEQAREALGELCTGYWRPVHAFIRRRVGDDESARDLTQEFFARLLAGTGVAGADPERGRFRSFLLGAVKHFLADTADKACAAKRGGGQALLSIETFQDGAESVEGFEPAESPTNRNFDREWAVSLVNRALSALSAEPQAADRAEAQRVLKPWLLGEPAGTTQADAAAQLGWTENAVRVAIHRLRRRFRELVRREIAQTVETEAEVQEELRYLLEVLVGE